MGSSDREEIEEVFDALEADVDRVCKLSFEALTTPELLRMLARLEKVARRLPVPGHGLINQLVQQATPQELGGKLCHVLAGRLRITGGDANRRVAEAADLGPRRALTGQPLAPRLTATAAVQRDGQLGAAHVAVIRRFLEQLPCWVDAETRESAEADLAKVATGHRPEALRKLADRLHSSLNPARIYSDEGRAPRRGWTPEARATVEAALAKLAAPGMCNPYDQAPTVNGMPAEEAVQPDNRSPAQRNHDALNAALRAILASGKLGQHNGLPASIIITTTLKDLESAAGKGLTG